jgi:hypothetical protein
MNELTRHLMKTADGFGAVTSMVMRTMGFLPDGRELVEEDRGEDRLTVRFPDRSREGWPGFEVHLPPDVEFDHATTSILTRGGMWRGRASVEEVARTIREGCPEGTVRSRRRRSGSVRLCLDGPSVKINLIRVDPRSKTDCRDTEERDRSWTLVLVSQKRDEEGVRRGLEARAEAWRGA